MIDNKKKKVFIVFAIILLLAIVLFAVLFANIANGKSYDKYLQTAKLSVENGDYESALSVLRKAEKIESSDEVLTLMADCYEKLGNYDKALEVLRMMDITNPIISARIASDESKKQNGAQAGLVTIDGSSYDSSDTSLVLDNRGLGNEIINQIVQLYSLGNLSIANNNISDISGLSVLGGLTTLNIKDNDVSDISALAALTSLRTLYLDNNPITDFTPLCSLPNLTFLSIKGVDITDAELKSLSAALPSCTINGANATEEVQTISLGGVTFSVDIKDPLDLSNRGITDISALSQCSNLTQINLSGNAITDISPLMDIQFLSVLDISNNSISDIRPLMGMSSLKTLNASNNNISNTTSLGANTAISELKLDNNPITNFSGLRKMKNLVILSLVKTGLQPSDIDYFTLLSKLISLDITDNSAITGEAFEQLQSKIPKCDITHSDLIYTFSFGGANISSDQTSLELPNQGISDLSGLLQFSKLESINLSGNIISDLYYFQIVSFRSTLKYLDLSNNNIMDLSSLSGLSKLEILNLSNNNIYSVTSLYSLDNLKELYLGGNQLTEEQIIDLNAHLPNCSIYN